MHSNNKTANSLKERFSLKTLKENSTIVNKNERINELIHNKPIKERFLSEVIDEVDDSKNEISMLLSNNKLNCSNNNIALNPIPEIANNKSNNIKINENKNLNPTSKQKKFITMDSFMSKDALKRDLSKEKIDTLKKNLKSQNDENVKSHNLLTFFKSLEINKNEKKQNQQSSNKIFESKDNKNKNNKNELISNLNENIFKSISDDNKNIELFNKEKSLSTNKAFINKFLLGKYYKVNCLFLLFCSFDICKSIFV